MTNDELVKKIEELLNTDADLDFLMVLKKKDLEKLVACIRGRADQVAEKGQVSMQSVSWNPVLNIFKPFRGLTAGQGRKEGCIPGMTVASKSPTWRKVLGREAQFRSSVKEGLTSDPSGKSNFLKVKRY